jgi:hypothetical protein
MEESWYVDRTSAAAARKWILPVDKFIPARSFFRIFYIN